MFNLCMVASYITTEQQLYFARMSQHHIKMVRLLEWAKLNYNPTSSVPLEVELGNGDRVELGDHVTVEFLILPREER